MGRLKYTVAHDRKGNVQETVYGYDANGNLVRAANKNSITCFDYNPNGQLIGQHHWKVPTQEENEANGLPETDWRDPQYDMLYLPQTESIRYHYDFNGNRTATVLPDGRQINHLYYGSGHLHSILFDGDTVTDIERDKLHREIQRTQGKLTSRYELDPVGRLKKQIAHLEALTEAKGKAKAAVGQTAVSRSYGYDKTGNLTHSTDQRSGTTHFEYDKLGRITRAGNERFAFDPAHNILSDGLKGKAVTDNRISEYNGTSYYYDNFGNLIHKELPNGEVQNYFYDLHDQLVKVEIFRKDGSKETWAYTYDALGRRIGKGRLKNGQEVSDGLEEEREFIWDGSHLLQEVYADGRYTYIYTDTDSYEPLAQIHNYTNEEGETYQETNYFHCDQIGIPREMTDKDGKLLWFGDYFGWGKLKNETNITDAHQPFRLQNQYFDRETGLHYNFFRYYEPEAGRFVNQDPIGLLGGMNLYQFAFNIQMWIDPLGWSTVYLRNGEVYVGKAKHDAKTRYGKKGCATDIYTGITAKKGSKKPDKTDMTDTDVAQGVEQIVYEILLEMKSEGLITAKITNTNRPVDPNKEKKKGRRTAGLDWLKENVGKNYKEDIRQKIIDHYEPKGKCICPQ